MAKPSVNILVNTSTNDVECSNPSGDSNFVLVASGDYVGWRDSQQVDGDPLTGEAHPVIIPGTGSIEAPKTFLLDQSEGEYDQIPLAGSDQGGQSGGNTRYVFAAYFSGATATVPYLEAWDDNTHSTIVSRPLGNGTPSASVFRGIATTNAAPGATNWSGTPLAGGTSNRIALDTGALSAAKYLYWNLRMVIPSTASAWPVVSWTNTSMVFTIHYTYS
jgi:hypothetical protein